MTDYESREPQIWYLEADERLNLSETQIMTLLKLEFTTSETLTEFRHYIRLIEVRLGESIGVELTQGRGDYYTIYSSAKYSDYCEVYNEFNFSISSSNQYSITLIDSS